MSLFNVISSLEVNRNYHLGRILILVAEFSNKGKNHEIEGLTKLAKLDFLLRYPVYLESAMEKVNKTKYYVKIKDHERKSVESKMVRFKYGPWDHRYREFINLLIALNLIYIRTEGKSIRIGVTELGQTKATELSADENFKDISERVKLIRRNFDWNGTRLKDFIYETFPEIITLQYGDHIK
ncbi:MAG TPA: hypothetical protein PLP23_18140 [Panacibacter sp.]|nr:hypothetical protein [Panacibacter sp.]